MAVNAQQSVAFELSTGLPTAGSANPAYILRSITDARLRDIGKVCVNSKKDFD